ncbi:MAG: GH92 family glycosyl hydrolase [Saprospiraceae bacterium]|nr:GH92 family glycosyl hydrolase [Saprospiraceae bacterium]
MRTVLFLILAIFSINLFSQITNYSKYVNPFIGTGGHGHTYPGAQVPFGMVQLSPDTRLTGWDGCSGYHYSDTIIYGFSHTHLNGTGVPDYCDILLMPVSGKVNIRNYGYASGFSHKNEKAKPGYYQVLLDKSGINVELTATQRTGVHKYSYKSASNNQIVLDLKHRDMVLASEIEIVNKKTIRGIRNSKAWAENQQVCFEIQFSVPFRSFELYQDGKLISNPKKLTAGKNLIAVFSFGKAKEIIVKTGVSPTSKEDASMNLKSECEKYSFEEVLKNATASWNSELSKIKVVSDNKDDMTVFYTALYHTMINPVIYNNADRSYLGRDFKKHDDPGFDYHTVFSLWDTYRAEHPLLTLIDQKRTNDFINTFISQYQQGGLLPVWELSSNETFCMIGYHSVPVIFDAFAKNIRNYDAAQALQAMKNSAEKDHHGLKYLRKYGYLPGDLEHESVSKTLEYAYDDWCIAMMAKMNNDEAAYKEYIIRAQFYKNIFDSKTGFMRPKFNGAWQTPFDPAEVTFNFTEANSWQYSFAVPHDISGLIKLHGGKLNLQKKLDELFTTSQGLTGRIQSDITGLIGQYAHGNEPSHHMAYLYNYLNVPFKTQEKVASILKTMYHNAPDGLSGNEDCGQMSAWYVLSSIGFYQVCPGNTQFAIGCPLFKEAKIQLENGKTFTVKTINRNDKNIYIQYAYLNGRKYNKSFLDYNDIMNGGTLEIKMDSVPNLNWGTSDDDIPKTSVDTFQMAIVPFTDQAAKTFRDSIAVDLHSVDKADIYYTLDGTNPDNNSMKYSFPIVLKETAVIKSVSYHPVMGYSYITDSKFVRTNEKMKIQLLTAYNSQYTGGGDNALINQLRGTDNFRLGEWQGYNDTDFEAILDLGEMRNINKISMGFLQDIGSWIWMPKNVSFEYSDDGKVFKHLGIVENTVPAEENGSVVKDFEIIISFKARYIKIKASKFGTIPEWHLGAGNPSWIFADEIVVE